MSASSRLPLKFYLDTQDYINFFNQPADGPANAIKRQLIQKREAGQIIIGYSWAIMLEFITRPTDKHREERIRRGELISELCGKNCFPFYSDLRNGAKFPNGGIWMTIRKGKLFSATDFRKKLLKDYRQTVSEQKQLNRHQRRTLMRSASLPVLLRRSGNTWGRKREDFGDFPVSDEIVESRILERFMKGECSDFEFESRLNKWFSDPSEFSRIAYDYGGHENLKDQFFGSALDSLEKSFENFQILLSQREAIKSSFREARKNMEEAGLSRRTARQITKLPPVEEFDTSVIVRKLEDVVGEGNCDHFGHYISKAIKPNFRFRRSDFFDLLQLCYVQDCDLFRCDKAMAQLFSDYEPFKGKLVGRLSELPDRLALIKT